MKIIRMIALHATCIFISLGYGLWAVLQELESGQGDEPLTQIGNNWKEN